MKSSSIRSDEGLTLETSAFRISVRWPIYIINSVRKTKFLNTIMDYDRVLVLDGGRVVEFDKPEVLIRKGGVFAEMIRSQPQRGKA